jgi:stage II sporulation protein D
MNRTILRFVFLFLLFSHTIHSYATRYLDILIYSNLNITNINLKVKTGEYILSGYDGSLGDFEKNSVFDLTIDENKIKLLKNGKEIGKYDSVFFEGKGFINTLLIKPASLAERIYDNDLKISVSNGFLRIINHVELENYVAGVVYAESGSFANQTFFEVQSILCRTYAINSVNKHWKEGYNLCDLVHCQVYKGKTSNSDVLMAVYSTKNKVVVDKDSMVITAAFHSNCGGQTHNSEDVWSKSLPYLRMVKDTFCIYQKNSLWQERMPASKWLSYLAEKYQYPVDDSIKKYQALHFWQPYRKIFFDEENKIPLKNIRGDMQFKSTWFSITPLGDTLVFQGRGYGHGVGLCQEGAVKMARMNYSYLEIIRFYFTDVYVVSLDEIEKKKLK